MKICFLRETKDTLCCAWYEESWCEGHHYEFFSVSPWHSLQRASRFEREEEARAAVDRFMDEWVPMMRQRQRERR